MGVKIKVIKVGNNKIVLFNKFNLRKIVIIVIDNVVKKFNVKVDKIVIFNVFIVVFLNCLFVW